MKKSAVDASKQCHRCWEYGHRMPECERPRMMGMRLPIARCYACVAHRENHSLQKQVWAYHEQCRANGTRPMMIKHQDPPDDPRTLPLLDMIAALREFGFDKRAAIASIEPGVDWEGNPIQQDWCIDRLREDLAFSDWPAEAVEHYSWHPDQRPDGLDETERQRVMWRPSGTARAPLPLRRRKPAQLPLFGTAG